MISAENVDRLGAGALDDGDVEIALLRVLLNGRLLDRREPRAFQKALERRVGRADARALLLLARVRLARGEPCDMQRETARRRKARRAFIEEAALDERVGHELAQVGRRLRLHARRDFLREEL